MTSLFDFALFCFTSLFTIVNPLGVMPIYVSMTRSLTKEQSRATARKAILTAFLLMVTFVITGQFIFDFFDISINSLRIVGGIIFFMIGYDMLQARLSRTKHNNEAVTEYVSDIAITPLAIPMICGPGAIATVIVLANASQSAAELGVVFGVIVLVLGLTYFLLRSGDRVLSILGDSGNKVLLRLMGLIVMVIAVEFFFSGLQPILRSIFLISPTG